MNSWKQAPLAIICIVLSGWTAANAAPPAGWFVAGSAPKDYEFGTDATASRNGGKSAYIKALKSTSAGFGTLMQNVSAERYVGSRVRLSAWMKTLEAGRGQMWLRIDAADRKVLGFDNMDSRPLTGTTEWRKYEIVLDVPVASKNIAFGFFLFGAGTVWADDFVLEVVDSAVPLTASAPPEAAPPREPVNASFEE